MITSRASDKENPLNKTNILTETETMVHRSVTNTEFKTEENYGNEEHIEE